MNNYAGAEITNLFPLASRLVSASSIDIDATSMSGDALVVHTAAVAVAGTSPTWDVVLQESDAVATGTLSQQTAGDVDIPLRNGATDNIKLSVSWTQSGARQIKYAYLRLARAGAVGSGKIVKVGIFADSTNDPGSQIGSYSASVAADTMSTDYSWVKFTFAVPIDVANSTKYHLVLEGDYNTSATVHVHWRILTAGSGGLLNIYDAAWGGAVTTQKPEVYLEQYNFSNVTSGDVVAGVVGGATGLIADEVILQINPNDMKQFYRGYATITGSNSPQFYAALAIISRQQIV